MIHEKLVFLGCKIQEERIRIEIFDFTQAEVGFASFAAKRCAFPQDKGFESNQGPVHQLVAEKDTVHMSPTQKGYLATTLRAQPIQYRTRVVPEKFQRFPLRIPLPVGFGFSGDYNPWLSGHQFMEHPGRVFLKGAGPENTAVTGFNGGKKMPFILGRGEGLVVSGGDFPIQGNGGQKKRLYGLVGF